MKNFKLKHVLIGLLIAYLAKSLVIDSNIYAVLICMILAGLTVFYEMSLSGKHAANLQKQIDEIVEKNQLRDRAIDDIKGSIVSVKVSSGIRGLTK
jgi:ABC-type uncharacterized transport system permease subunit